MPYIEQEEREKFDKALAAIPDIHSAGELNYVLTKIAGRYSEFWNGGYAIFNEVVGVLESAKLEFYRRLVADYEDVKRAQNGDVYTLD